ncbi:hypothetical protein AB0P21_27760 [Kribbella sp. NPDC056861]|uniref:hypothetical protein n=1 Tax=Kribbella sp. NPDC056861 TaxID=3154857 RepID=UPI00341F7F9D
MTDMVYLWPEGLEHRVKDHDVRLPAQFVKHVRAQALKMDDLEVDDSWWRDLRPGSEFGLVDEKSNQLPHDRLA